MQRPRRPCRSTISTGFQVPLLGTLRGCSESFVDVDPFMCLYLSVCSFGRPPLPGWLRFYSARDCSMAGPGRTRVEEFTVTVVASDVDGRTARTPSWFARPSCAGGARAGPQRAAGDCASSRTPVSRPAASSASISGIADPPAHRAESTLAASSPPRVPSASPVRASEAPSRTARATLSWCRRQSRALSEAETVRAPAGSGRGCRGIGPRARGPGLQISASNAYASWELGVHATEEPLLRAGGVHPTGGEWGWPARGASWRRSGKDLPGR